MATVQPVLEYSGPKVGLVLTGGGARAAYQVGVLKAVRDLLPPQAPNPFSILCGTSAGAVNAATLAVLANDFDASVNHLLDVWQHFHVHHVYRSDAPAIILSGASWLAAMMLIRRRSPFHFWTTAHWDKGSGTAWTLTVCSRISTPDACMRCLSPAPGIPPGRACLSIKAAWTVCHGSAHNAWVAPWFFEPAFCNALIDLGYEDTMARKDEVRSFLVPYESRRDDIAA